MGSNNNLIMDKAVEVKSKRDITSTLAPYTGTFGIAEITHLLKRTMFGAAPQDVAYFSTKTITQAINELLTPTATDPAPPIKEYATSTTTGVVADANIAVGTTWINDINNDGTVQAQRRTSYRKWATGVLLNQDRSIKEKLTLFWLNHFGTEADEIGNATHIYQHNMLMRNNVLGNFKNLVKLVTTDIAMLRYLNGYVNIATAPDENYGRELQELFTVGKGPGSQYTESDVKEAAKVLTGWRINYTNYTVSFNPALHSTVNKQFSAFYNNTVITGRTGATAGALELDDMLNMIFSTQELAKHLMRKLYRWFVYYEIDPATEANIITPLANMFRTNNYEIKPCLDALLKSQHFFDVLNRGCQIKSPIDLVVGSCREFGVVLPALTTAAPNEAYQMYNYLSSICVNLQQDYHNPPNVSGWPAYYQTPKFYEIWVNTDTLPKRNIYTDTMINTGYTANGKKIMFDAVALARLMPNPSDPNELVKDIDDRFLRVGLSPVSRAQIKTQILLSNQTSDYYWTNAWNAYIASPTTANLNIINTRLKELCKYLMNLAEYQLC